MILAGCQFCQAESYQALAIQKAVLYGDQVEVSEAQRHHLLSRGQEYLRYYLRDEMLRNMAGRWLAIETHTMQTGFKFELQDFLHGTEKAFTAEMRIYADEDLNKYLECGYLLPIEVEMDSFLRIGPNVQLQAKVEVPFDNVMRFQLGSKVDWNQSFYSSIQYRLSNSSDIYEGLTMGTGLRFSNWRCKVNYEIAADMTQIQHLSIARDF